MEERTRIDLPPHVTRPFEVYVNGIPQRAGADYDVLGDALVFRRELRNEGRLGFWRWASLFMGVAGTYRKNDTVDVVHMLNGKRTVTSLPLPSPGTSGAE